jgi:hypothetical protein
VKNYLVYPPTIPLNLYKVDFSVSIGGTIWKLFFAWSTVEERWRCTVYLPTGDIREAGLYVDVYNWSGHTDYGILFHLDDKEYVGLNDLGKTAIICIDKSA